MPFAFGGLNVNSTKKSLGADLITEIVQIERTTGSGPKVLVLLDEFYPPDKLRKITAFLEKNGIRNFQAVNALNVKMTRDELKGEISKFYRTSQSKWKNHLEGVHAIISVGPALYSINQSADLMVDHFYDVVFNRSYFWSPDAQRWVFPIDSFNEIFAPIAPKDGNPLGNQGPVNTYKTHFAEYQFKQVTSIRLPAMMHQTPNLILVDTQEKFDEMCNKLMYSDILSADLETSGFDHIKDRIGCITLSNDGVTAYFVPWGPTGDWGAIVCQRDNIRKIDQLFETAKIVLGANFKFDIRFLWRAGVLHARVDEDTVQLGHVLNEQRSNSLKAHAFVYTEFGGYDRELDRYKEKTGVDDYTLIPLPIIFPYATLDVIVAYRAYFAMKKQLELVDKKFPNEKNPEWTMYRYYKEIMMPAVMAFAKIEYTGVYTDRAALAESRIEILTEIEEIETELRAIWNTGPDFDFNSSHALGRLFEELGFEDLGRMKTGEYQTADAMLERWAQGGHKEVKKLQRLRSLKTVLKTFISTMTAEEGAEKGWEQYIRRHNEDDSWRMHPTYNVMRTETGRNKSDSPNMQNVPAHGDLAEKVKRCITTPNNDEYFLCTVDYASLQIRLAAIDTSINPSGKDMSLYNVYIDPKMGGDMHSRTGHSVFASDKEFELDIIEVDDGKGNKKTFFGGENVKTKRGDVKARDLQPTDELL